MREPQVVGRPSMARTSLIATGTPARAGAGRPSASARSTARAFSSARSSRTSRYASTLPSTAFKRARWAFATSSADTSRATTFRRISEADSSWRALIRRGPEARGRGRPWDRERSRGRGPGRGPPAEHPPGGAGGQRVAHRLHGVGVQGLDRLRVFEALVELAREEGPLLVGEGQASQAGHVVDGLDGHLRHDPLIYRFCPTIDPPSRNTHDPAPRLEARVL